MKKSVSIERLPGGYSVRHWVLTGETNPFTGKPVYKRQRQWVADHNAAQELKARLRLQKAAKQQGLADPTLTTVAAFDEYIEWCRTHPHKRGDYRPATLEFKIDHMRDFIKEKTLLQDITEPAITAFERKMHKQGLSLTTIKMRLTEIRAFLNWCVKEAKYIEMSPFKLSIRIPTTPRRKLSVTEIEQFETYLDPKFIPLYTLIKEHGTRVTETLLARGEDISLANRTWFIPAANAKGKMDRTIPLSLASVAALSVLGTPELPPGPLFPGWGETAPNYYLSKALKAAKKAGVVFQHIHPHLFRHTRASNWRGNVYAMMDYMGWKSMAMGKLYSHHDIDDLRREAEIGPKMVRSGPYPPNSMHSSEMSHEGKENVTNPLPPTEKETT